MMFQVTHNVACLMMLEVSFMLKVDYLITCIICDTDSVNKLTLQMYTLHKYK